MQIRVGIVTASHIDYEQCEKTFILPRVRIGIGFHWDREESQEFAGTLSILRHPDGSETAVNTIDIEDYLCSVISSEMSSSSPIELLKAHAIISRTWVRRLLERERRRQHVSSSTIGKAVYEDGGHRGFDVCADDHCQRYEGLRRMNDRAIRAVKATKGMVLTYEGELCDTRFSKCCGGRTERFDTCWEDVYYPYLDKVDCPYCQQAHSAIQRLILNDYDQETHEFFSWTETYSQSQLQHILYAKTGIDFGSILALRPLQRGVSGRISLLEIVGSKQTRRIGKELCIRRSLSQTCLRSSWMDIESISEGEPYPTRFIFHGKGWGHGVGLCQIGAAVMAIEGKSCEEILRFYYPHTTLAPME